MTVNSLYVHYIKRWIDFSIAFLLLILLSPLLLLFTLLIWVDDPGPIFFKQTRAGFKAKPFTILKFRSMVVQQQDPIKQAFLDDPRITRVGRLLRRFKADELPQLWNVLIGDMSLIGPRPTLLEQMKDYTPEQHIRYEVRPGLSGWAQVNGNIMLSVYDRREHDVYYVKNLSFGLDLKISWLTVAVVLFGEKLKDTK
jgi:undecaprenyl phosphate N,N'-diacetylbacillosamine 1-phosphate transferase